MTKTIIKQNALPITEQVALLQKEFKIQLRLVPGRIVRLDPKVYRDPDGKFASKGLVFGWTKIENNQVPFAIKISDEYLDYSEPDIDHFFLEVKDFTFWSLAKPEERAFWQVVTNDYSANLAQSVKKFLGQDNWQIDHTEERLDPVIKLRTLAKAHALALPEALFYLETIDSREMLETAVPDVLFSKQEVQDILASFAHSDFIYQKDRSEDVGKTLLTTVNNFVMKYHRRYQFDPIPFHLAMLEHAIADEEYVNYCEISCLDKRDQYLLKMYLDDDNLLRLTIKKRSSYETVARLETYLPYTIFQTYIELTKYTDCDQFKAIKVFDSSHPIF